jgi:hypothetical protein
MKFHRLNLLYPLAIAAGLVGLAMAPIPGQWTIMDDSRICHTYPGNVQNISMVKVTNKGPDDVMVYVKIKNIPVLMFLGAVPALGSGTFALPANPAKVCIEDAPPGMPDGDTAGARGTLLWIG